MKDFLLALFYQAIVAVNTAVILSSIIWLAKRKEEKDERKPNPDFTLPPTRHSGGYQPKPYEMPEPPTAGSAAIKPKYGISAEEAAKLIFKLAEVSACLGGNSELDELRERVKDLSDRLDRIEKKPVTPERLKEAGFEAEYLNAKCGECKNWKRDNQIFGHCALRRCPVKEYERRQCQFFEKWEPPAKTTHICRNCKHYLATDEDAMTGLCGMKDEIAFGNSCRACFEKQEGE